MNLTIETATFPQLKTYYDTVLNTDKTSFVSSNDEPTPIGCVQEMLAKVPAELWHRPDLRILDPCCGNGKFALPIVCEMARPRREILETVLEFNDLNKRRLATVRRIFCEGMYRLKITRHDFLTHPYTERYDLIVVNPPYRRLSNLSTPILRIHFFIIAYCYDIIKIRDFIVYRA